MRSRLSFLLLASFLGACQVGSLPADSSSGATTGQAPLGAPYPIVLCHGMLGEQSYLGILDYWSTIPDALAAAGHEVYITEVDPLNTPEVRGAQLVAQLEDIVAETGREKVILIGHSQGGLDIRYAASTRPDLVAAAISMASPHNGTPAVDIALAILEDGGTVEDVSNWLVDTFGPLIWPKITDETSLFASLHSMTVEGVAEFAAKYPDSPGVGMYSLTGVTDDIPMDHPDCVPDVETAAVSRWATETDPASFPLSIAEALLDDDDLLDLTSNTYPNDGLVRAIDTHWGTFLGCVPADHGEEIGLQAGALPDYHPGCEGLYCDGSHTDTATCSCNDFVYEAFWVDLAAWLRAQGY